MACGPRPALNIKEARRSDDDTVLRANDSEGDRGAGVSPGERGVDVSDGLFPALRHGAPAVEFGVGACGGDQAVDVAKLQGFEANVVALEDRTLRAHGIHYAMSGGAIATTH